MTQNDYKQFDKQIDALIKKMTLRQKIGQLHQIMAPKAPEDVEYVKGLIKRGEVGSLILADTATAGKDEQQPINAEYMNELQRCAVEQGPHGIPLIYGRDVIHGHHTVFPIPLASACSFNPELIEASFRATAKEASAAGIHWTFAPMLDLCHDPRWGRIIECTGEDPYVGACFARAAVRGLQGDNLTAEASLVACAKHFLGYGYSEGGRDYHRTELSDYTLYNYVLPAFRAAIDEGVGTVMSSFNDIGGVPVSGSAHYLTEMLREKLGFEGFVISDWDSVVHLINHGVAEDRRECARQALTAGIDMDMADHAYISHLEELVTSGELSEDCIDLAVRRVLRVKMAKGLFDQPYITANAPDRSEHIRLARALAAESMILLKNKNGTLPLKKNARITLSGEFAESVGTYLGSWSLDGVLSDAATLKNAMTEAVTSEGGELNFIKPDETTKDALSHGDIIVLALGESHTVTGETTALADISLTESQLKLAKLAHNYGKPVIGVIFGGRPICLGAVEPYLDSILYAWHAGTETAHAVTDILFGDSNPCGKAAITFLRSTGHIPLYYNSTSDARGLNCYYGGDISYLDTPAQPMYPFGYGLSYTRFELSDIRCEKDRLKLEDIKSGEKFKLSVKIKNIGNRSGKETVQLYLRDPVASMMRPWRELKAWKKPELKAGEELTLTFELGADKLGFYDGADNYLIERGKLEVYIGDSCLTENKTFIFIE